VWVTWWLLQCVANDCGIWSSGKTKEAALAKWNRRTTPNTEVSDAAAPASNTNPKATGRRSLD
jgi:hypothetical protein